MAWRWPPCPLCPQLSPCTSGWWHRQPLVSLGTSTESKFSARLWVLGLVGVLKYLLQPLQMSHCRSESVGPSSGLSHFSASTVALVVWATLGYFLSWQLCWLPQGIWKRQDLRGTLELSINQTPWLLVPRFSVTSSFCLPLPSASPLYFFLGLTLLQPGTCRQDLWIFGCRRN